MDFATKSTEELQKIQAETLASLAKRGSANLYRTRLGILGAVSAALATR